ncbi:MAG: hypothetical protein CME88_00015 [Hirschia sp.]|nr:hypothetical protein [Hirschia sp.]MBF16744.1 hypothetical protein [Hirschia sp.]
MIPASNWCLCQENHQLISLDSPAKKLQISIFFWKFDLPRIHDFLRLLADHRNLIIAFSLLASLVLQVGLVKIGYWSSAADESARTLLAYDLTYANVLDPFIWPPLTKVVQGLALWVWNDLFWTPRIVSQITGLVSVVILALLAQEITKSRAMSALTAILSVCFQHRLLFALAPMSESIYNPLILLFFYFLLKILQIGQRRDLYLACTFLALAAATRYEAWFLSVPFGLTIAWTGLIKRQLKLTSVIWCALILSSFPIAWLGLAAFSESGVSSLFITRDQAIAMDAGWRTMVSNSHLVAFLRDIVSTPLMFGLIALVVAASQDMKIRYWAYAVLGSLVVVTIATFLTGSIAFAAPWRLGGVWSLLLLPFLASFIFWVIEQFQRTSTRNVVAAALIMVTVSGFGLQSILRVRHTIWNPPFSQNDLSAGRFLRGWLSSHDGRILVESSDYHFLNVIVASNTPERVSPTSGDDPQLVALYIGRSEYWRKTDQNIYAEYIAPNYGLDADIDVATLRDEGIKLILANSPDLKTALSNDLRFKKVVSEGEWVGFEL